MLSVCIRRLHGIGKLGWRTFVAMIPMVGPIMYLVAMAADGAPAANQYVPFPHGRRPSRRLRD